jgi:hypothetical protein
VRDAVHELLVTEVSLAHRLARAANSFAEALTGEVDVLGRMHGPVFEQARTPSGFQAATVDPESATVVESNGANLAPDTLYQRVSTGLWPAQSAAA